MTLNAKPPSFLFGCFMVYKEYKVPWLNHQNHYIYEIHTVLGLGVGVMV